jgi:hypothetical protein
VRNIAIVHVVLQLVLIVYMFGEGKRLSGHSEWSNLSRALPLSNVLVVLFYKKEHGAAKIELKTFIPLYTTLS